MGDISGMILAQDFLWVTIDLFVTLNNTMSSQVKAIIDFSLAKLRRFGSVRCEDYVCQPISNDMNDDDMNNEGYKRVMTISQFLQGEIMNPALDLEVYQSLADEETGIFTAVLQHLRNTRADDQHFPAVAPSSILCQ
jgi:hypothetical protein